MFKLSSASYYVLCRVFLLLFPLGIAALLHRKLATTNTSHDSRHVQGRSSPLFYVSWCSVCRRGAQIFQQYRSHPKILGARRMSWRKFSTERPKILGATVPNLGTTATWCPGFVCLWSVSCFFTENVSAVVFENVHVFNCPFCSQIRAPQDVSAHVKTLLTWSWSLQEEYHNLCTQTKDSGFRTVSFKSTVLLHRE
jgi:hypothetical protein